MLEEKKKIDVEKSKLLAHLVRGGELLERDEDEVIPGVDCPADIVSVKALEAFG